jgi:lipopolysaccharide biosynthesis glycosyltransferase
MEGDDVAVVLCVDVLWAQPALACVRSLRRRGNVPDRISIVVVTDDPEADALRPLRAEGCVLVPVDPEEVPALRRPAAPHVASSTCMWRLALPRLLLPRWQWALYLDADVAAAKPLDELLARRPRLLAARPLETPAARGRAWRRSWRGALLSPPARLPARSFNAGVMMLNLQACLALGLEAAAGRCATNDQLLLNLLAADAWEELPLEDNWPAPPDDARLPQGVRLVHFQGPRKPWRPADGHAWEAWWRQSGLSRES